MLLQFTVQNVWKTLSQSIKLRESENEILLMPAELGAQVLTAKIVRESAENFKNHVNRLISSKMHKSGQIISLTFMSELMSNCLFRSTSFNLIPFVAKLYIVLLYHYYCYICC